MQIYGPFRLNTAQPDRGIQRATPAQSSTGTTGSSSINPIDQLDLSAEAQATNRLRVVGGVDSPSTEIRAERIAEIRRGIADGSYDSPDKLDAALDRFLNQLG